MGFYTTRFVLAENPEEAENTAVSGLKNSEKLKDVVLNNSDHKSPVVYLEEIYEIQKEEMESEQGLAWYEMNEKHH